MTEGLAEQKDGAVERLELFEHQHERCAEGISKVFGRSYPHDWLRKPRADVFPALTAGGAELINAETGDGFGEPGFRQIDALSKLLVELEVGFLNHVLPFSHAAKHPVGDAK